MVPLSASQLPPDEIRPGEQIAYYSMAFVCGGPRGYREAVVLGVNTSPDASKALTLDSGDIIAPTMMLKRIVNCSGRRIAEGKALWRKLRTFKLVAGVYDAPTRASAFNQAIKVAVRQAFAAAYQAGGVLSEEIPSGLSGVSTSAVVAPATDSPASSAPSSSAMSSPRRESRIQSSEQGAPCEDSEPVEANVETDVVPADAGDPRGAQTASANAGDPRGAQTASATAEDVAQLQLSGIVPRTSAEEPENEALASSAGQRSQHVRALNDVRLVDLNDYLRSIPTRLERAKIRHQAKKRPASWHVSRSRKRRNQKKCAVTRSGTSIYHAHTVKARSTKDILQRAGVKDRLRAFMSGDQSSWDQDRDVGPGEGSGLANLQVGDVVGEYVGRLFEYPAVLEGQPAQAIKQNSGYTMLLNTQSTSGMFIYVEALKCGSITRFMSHSCDPNVEFVEMQNRTNVKVLARMIKSAPPGTQLTVNYGDEIWFKCACDSCWVDPDDKEE
ncbi:Hypothetical protein PHPALM_36363 [Phytophthora palmivora]|uniref:SET domain-containing protein n=1 Tax=Phytophthora palmivora TaxID=4796 RepID=A0A2P4X051_9STRA|nr:Hypothetical protein PHPALM_36363 [Phytophthora palmivora]